MISYEKINKLTPFEDNMSQNDLLSSHITVSSIFLCVQHFTVSSSILCPTHYSVQHIIVSNKILCPHLPKGSFVSFHISMCCGRIRLRLRSTYFRIIFEKLLVHFNFNKAYSIFFYNQFFNCLSINLLYGVLITP